MDHNSNSSAVPRYCKTCGGDLRPPNGRISGIWSTVLADDGEHHFECWARPQQKWRPIDTAPKDGTEILAYWSGSGTMRVLYYADQESELGMRWADENDYWSSPTHWTPLPNPPEAVQHKR